MGPIPLLVTSGGYHFWDLFKLDHLWTHPSPLVLTSGGHRSTYGWQAGSTYPTGMLSCYRPQWSLGKVMFLQASVILLTLLTGGLSQCMLGYHPPLGSRPPWEQTPQEQIRREQTPPPVAQSMLGDTVNARAVRILLECNLVVHSFQLINSEHGIPKSKLYANTRLVQCRLFGGLDKSQSCVY